jgi:hypothetical protein
MIKIRPLKSTIFMAAAGGISSVTLPPVEEIIPRITIAKRPLR